MEVLYINNVNGICDTTIKKILVMIRSFVMRTEDLSFSHRKWKKSLKENCGNTAKKKCQTKKQLMQ